MIPQKANTELTKVELARLRLKKRAEAEQNYIDLQRNKTWPIAIGVAILMLLLCCEYVLKPDVSHSTITKIELEKGQSEDYIIDFPDGTVKILFKDVPPFVAGDQLELHRSPHLKDIEKVVWKGEEFKPVYSFYGFEGYPLAAAICLLYSALAARTRLPLWFQFWIFGLIGTFVSVLMFLAFR